MQKPLPPKEVIKLAKAFEAEAEKLDRFLSEIRDALAARKTVIAEFEARLSGWREQAEDTERQVARKAKELDRLNTVVRTLRGLLEAIERGNKGEAQRLTARVMPELERGFKRVH